MIAGPAAAVAQAEDDIKDLFRTQSRTTLEIRFDPEQKGTLLGKGGSTINEIQKKSGGAILEIAKGAECSIKVSGPNQAVMRARKLLAELLHLDAASVKIVEMPFEVVDKVIGRGGENVRRLEKEHGVSIDSARLDSKSTETYKVKIRGRSTASRRR